MSAFLSSPVQQSRQPGRRQPWRRWVMVLSIILSAWFIWWMIKQQFEQASLQQVLAKWDQEGNWRWQDVMAGRPPVSDEANIASLILRMADLVPTNIYQDEELEHFQHHDQYPQHRSHEKVMAVLREREKKSRSVSELLPVLLSMNTDKAAYPVKAHGLPMDNMQNGIQAVRIVSHRFQDLLSLALEENDVPAAVKTLQGQYLLIRSLDHEPGMLPHMIQLGMLESLCWDCQRFLALAEPLEDQLTRLQEYLADFDSPVAWQRALRTEAGVIHEMVHAIDRGELEQKGPLQLNENLDNSNGLLTRVKSLFLIDKQNTHTQHALCLDRILSAYRMSAQPWSKQREALSRSEAEVQNPSQRRMLTLFNRSIINMINACHREMNTMANLRCIQLAVAAERFRRQNNRWPSSQAELTGRFLKEPLLDPYDDQPLRLRKLEDGLVIYSLGKNERDDQGDVMRQAQGNPPMEGGVKLELDVGVRLWEVNRRRQPSLPPLKN